ncbi:MAG: ABC transporter permease subunit/CPBP intramembrane protease [Planctomycetota bacterium]
MSPKIRAVLVKELRDLLRDRRTIFAAVVVPLLLWPVMMLGMSEVAQLAQARIEHEVYTVAIPPGMTEFFDIISKLPDTQQGDAAPASALEEDLGRPVPKPRARDAFQVPAQGKSSAPALAFRALDSADAEKALAAGEIQAAVSVPQEIEQLIEAQQPVKIEVRYDQAENRSREARDRVEKLLERYKQHVVDEHLKSRNLKREFLKPFTVALHNVAQATKVGGSVLGAILPLLFIMMIITGSIYPAIDLTAGEKERSTLETLVGMPVRPIELISGKFLAVAILALGNAGLNVASFAGTFLLLPNLQLANFQFPWAALPLTLLLLVPLALLFAGLLLAVASLAANQKEAQVYCLPVYLLPMLGMMVVTMPGIELGDGPLLLAPVINTALLIKELFLGHGKAWQIGFVFCSTCLYAAGTVAVAARFFAREEILFSSQNSLRLFLNRRFYKPAPHPKPGDALLLLALLFPISFYCQLALMKVLLDPVTGLSPAHFCVWILAPQYLLFLALPLAVAWYLKLDWKETFLWRRPALSAVLGGACLGTGAWLIAMQLSSWQSCFWPYPVQEMEVLEKPLALLSKSVPGLLLLIFLFGVTPALCEEHLFRGFLLQGLRGSGKVLALVSVGVIFGAYHFPMFRQPVVMLLGVVLAYVAWQSRSLLPGVVLHFCFNSMNFLGTALPGLDKAGESPGKPLPGVPLKYLLPALVLFAAGLWLVRRGANEGKRTESGWE